MAIQRGTIIDWDGLVVASVAKSLWYHHSVRICCDAFGAFPLDPQPFAKYGIGMSLLLAPLWGLDGGATPAHALWLTALGPAMAAVSAAQLVRIGFLLGWRGTTATIVALIYTVGTLIPVYSQTLFAEVGVALGISTAMLGIVRWRTGACRLGALWLGGGVALSALFRPDSFLLVGPMLLAILAINPISETWADRRTWLRFLMAPLVLVAGWTAIYNIVRFGSPIDFGYGGPYDTAGFSNPLLKGLALQLVSPGEGLFWYSPILLLMFPGLVYLARRDRIIAALVVGLVCLRAVFYAKWWAPVGGISWGPRFLLPLCPLMLLPLGEFLERMRTSQRALRAGTAIVLVLATVSMAGQLLAAAVSWQVVEHRGPDVWALGSSPIFRNLSLWKERGSIELYWFQPGRVAIGVSLAIGGVVLWAMTVVVARRADRQILH